MVPKFSVWNVDHLSPTLIIDFSLPAILWVGKLGRRKNVDFLLNTAPYLKGELQLLFVGPSEDPAYFSELKQMASFIEKKSRIKVRFLGRVDDGEQLEEIYKKSKFNG